MRRVFHFALFMVLLSASLSAQSDALPEGEGRKAFEEVCKECHETDTVTSQRQTKDEWRRTIMKMEAKGAEASDDDFNKIVDYLAKNFGPERVNINRATADAISGTLGITADDARAIVKYRKTVKAFKTWDEVKKTPGLDVKRMEARKDLLLF